MSTHELMLYFLIAAVVVKLLMTVAKLPVLGQAAAAVSAKLRPAAVPEPSAVVLTPDLPDSAFMGVPPTSALAVEPAESWQATYGTPEDWV